jgi:hypothetical protein
MRFGLMFRTAKAVRTRAPRESPASAPCDHILAYVGGRFPPRPWGSAKLLYLLDFARTPNLCLRCCKYSSAETEHSRGKIPTRVKNRPDLPTLNRRKGPK